MGLRMISVPVRGMFGIPREIVIGADERELSSYLDDNKTLHVYNGQDYVLKVDLSMTTPVQVQTFGDLLDWNISAQHYERQNCVRLTCALVPTFWMEIYLPRVGKLKSDTTTRNRLKSVWKPICVSPATIYNEYYDKDVSSRLTPGFKKYWELTELPVTTPTVSLMRNGIKHLFMNIDDLHEWRGRRDPSRPYRCSPDCMEINTQAGATLRQKSQPAELHKWIT